MTDTQATPRTRVAVLKVLYLLAVTAAVFTVPAVEATRPARWGVVPGLLLLQAAILVRYGVERREVFRPAWRLKWLFVVLFACYAFLPGDGRRGEDDWREVPVLSVAVNLGGLSVAGLMCLQILTVLLASAVVRLTGPGTDLVVGLRAFRFPLLFVCALDLVLGRLGGIQPQAGGGGRRHDRADDTRSPAPGFFTVLRRLVRGDARPFTRSIRDSLEQAREDVERQAGERIDHRLAHDAAVIGGIGLVMVTFKMLKVLPGVPFASGHKTLLLFPLYLLAARLTNTFWGATAAGAVMGVVGFLQGDGRFGVLEVFKHLAPGLVIDLLMPVVRRLPERAWVYCLLGFLAGVARSATDFAVVLLLGARSEVYLFLTIQLLPMLAAGTLSGFVAVAVLKAFPHDELPGPPAGGPEESREPVSTAIEEKP